MKKALGDNEFLGEIEFSERLDTKKEERVELTKSWAGKMVELSNR